MAKKTSPPKKANRKKAVQSVAVAPRVLKPKVAKRRWFRISHPDTPPKKIRNSWQISRDVLQLLWGSKGMFMLLAVIYGLLTFVFVRGFSGGVDVGALKNQLSSVVGGNSAPLNSSLTIFNKLISTSGNTSGSSGGAYQLFLLLIFSLATIWILRATIARESFRLREAFYKGMYPLIPFFLVLLVVSLQLLPFLVGAGLYSQIVGGKIAVSFVEILPWLILFLLLSWASLYMLCSSLFALYIAALPDMTPMKALRSARKLVRHRRLSVVRKLLFLPLILFVIAAVIMLPVILLAPVLAQWLFFFLTMAGLIVVHAYMYTLYRELLA